MVKKQLLIVFFGCLLTTAGFSQKVSSFDSLVNVLEKKFSVQFLYDTKHTEGLTIGVTTGSLEEIIKNVLEGAGLTYYIDPYKRVIISRGSSVFTPLPKNFFGNALSTTGAVEELTKEEVVIAAADNKVYTIGTKNNNAPTAILCISYVS